MDTELRHIGSFALHGADVAERLMQPLPVVEHFDELKDLHLGFVAAVVVPLMDQFILQRAKEAFDDGIVVTVPLTAHARHEARLRQELLIGTAGIQGPLIGVVNQAGRWAALRHDHAERLQRHLLIGTNK